jgi:hypothetical protein
MGDNFAYFLSLLSHHTPHPTHVPTNTPHMVSPGNQIIFCFTSFATVYTLISRLFFVVFTSSLLPQLFTSYFAFKYQPTGHLPHEVWHALLPFLG